MQPTEIKELRAKIGISQERLAYLLSTTCVTVNRWENGRHKPSKLYIRALRELQKDYGLYIRRHKKSEES